MQTGIARLLPKGAALALAAAATLAIPTRAELPPTWAERDIGAVGVTGSASASGTDWNNWIVSGSGADIYATADAFHYAYQRLNGSGQVVLQVHGLINTHPWSKAGIMIREDLTPGSRHAMVGLTPGNGVEFLSRSTPGSGSVSATTPAIAAPRWLRLDRVGDVFTAWQSADGASWTAVGSSRVIGMQPSVHVGIAVCSHDNAQNTSMTASGFQVRPLSALLVAGSAMLGSGDAAVKRRLEALGFAVTVKAAASAVAADANGRHVVLVSSTVASGDVNTKFRASAVPVVTWENAILDDLGMTGTAAGTDYGTTANAARAEIEKAACDRATMYTQAKNWGDGCHDLAAGLSGQVPVSESAGPLTWGKPGAAAVKIAYAVGAPTRSLVFAYEKGAAMPGLAAPARRVSLWMGDNSAASWTGQGQSLFDQAVLWAAGIRHSVTRKVLALHFDPKLATQNNQRFHAYMGWQDPVQLTRDYLADLTEASGGYVRWKLAKYPEIPEYLERWVPIVAYPQFGSEEFPESEVLRVYRERNWADLPRGGQYRAAYEGILDEYGVDAKVNAGEVDEVILYGYPYAGFWESQMVGDRPYFLNSTELIYRPARNYVVMGLSYERGVGEALESFGHRAEWLLNRTFGTWTTLPYVQCYWPAHSKCQVRQPTQVNSIWDRFSLVQGNLATGYSDPSWTPGVGAAHWTPNATVFADEYVYGKTLVVNSLHKDWMFAYPRLGTLPATSVNVDTWRPFAQDLDAGRGFRKWWMWHMPRLPGVYRDAANVNNDGRLNNWWEYLVNFNQHPETAN